MMYIGIKMKKKTLGVVLLAAGNSRRYDGIKLLERINGIPMYHFMLDHLEHINLKYKLVVTQYDEIMTEAKKKGIIVVKNDNPQRGISYSIQLGIKELGNRADVDGIMFSVCDQPFITLETLERLKETFEYSEYSLICAGSNGKLGNPCIFGKKFFHELMELDKDVGGKHVIQKHLEEAIVIDVNEIELTDIDTKEDAEQILHLLKQK